MKELGELIKSTAMSVVIIGVIHYKWEAVVPLVTQSILGPYKLFGNNLFKSHILKQHVQRPFPAPPGLLGGK